MPFFPQVFLPCLGRDLLWEPEVTRSPDRFALFELFRLGESFHHVLPSSSTRVRGEMC